MIQKINYEFNDTLDSSLWYEVPGISIKTSPDLPYDCFLDMELSLLTWEHVRSIVQNLEEVKTCKREKEVFGFEMIIMWVYNKWKWYYWEKYPESEVTITYNYADDYIVTDLTIDDILKMMTDWRDYIDAWEKETWKIKK